MNENTTERYTESLMPEFYEIEITEKNQKLTYSNAEYNETSQNDTVGYSGEFPLLTLSFFRIQLA